MRPYYADESVTLYHGDCREVDAWLQADSLVTDPPYGRAWKQGRHWDAKHTDDRHQGIANDDSTVARDLALAMWHGKAIVFGDLMLAPPAGTKQVLIYRKPPNSGVRGAMGGRRRDVEAIYLVGPWPSGIGGASSIVATSEPSQGNPSSPQGRYGHPHAKPMDVMSELVGMTEGVVADPFAGSGSTLVAAKVLGRRAIGVELDEAYCETVAKRLSQGVLDFGETA